MKLKLSKVGLLFLSSAMLAMALGVKALLVEVNDILTIELETAPDLFAINLAINVGIWLSIISWLASAFSFVSKDE